jgi:hypothetical protein
MTTASPAHGRQYPNEGNRETKPPLGSASSVHPTGAAMEEQSDTPIITAEMVHNWRINYGLDVRSPRQAAAWWSEQFKGFAPAGAVAALGLCLEKITTATRERDEARAEVERLRSALFFVIEDADVWHDIARGGQSDNITANIRALAATEAKP